MHNNPAIKQFQGGFTLVELLVTLSIVAILTAIGIPSYISFITSSNIAAESTALMGDLQFARSQAIKQGQVVSICTAYTNGTPGAYACAGTTDWKIYGWVVYTGNTTGIIPAASFLRIQKPFTTTDTINSGSTTTAYQWCFNSFGFPSVNYNNGSTNQCILSTTLKGSVTVAPASGTVTSQTVCVSSVGSMQSVAGSNSLCP